MSIDFFERAIEIDPQSAEARSRLSGVFSSRAIEGMTDTRKADIVRAEQLATEAVTISPRTFFPHFAKAWRCARNAGARRRSLNTKEESR